MGRLELGDWVQHTRFGWEGDVSFVGDGRYGQTVEVDIGYQPDGSPVGGKSVRLLAVEFTRVPRRFTVEIPDFLAYTGPLAIMQEPVARARRLAGLVDLAADETLVETTGQDHHGGAYTLTIQGEPYRVLTWRQHAIRGPRDGHALRADRLATSGPNCVAYSWSGDWAAILENCRAHTASLGDPGADRLIYGEWVTWTEHERVHTAKVVRHEGNGVWSVSSIWTQHGPLDYGAERVARTELTRCPAPDHARR